MNSSSPMVVLSCRDIGKTYKTGTGDLTVLEHVNFDLQAGEMVALVGPSGAGKSTLLHICGLLDKQSTGALELVGQEAGRLNDAGRTALRREHIGFVYQQHRLLPEFSAAENIIVPQLIAGISRKAARARAEELLALVGLSARAEHRPGKLSGGEQQRVAICRALANHPRLLIADEPTGNLDPATGNVIFELFRKLANHEGVTTLLATHNMELAKQADKILELRDRSVYFKTAG